jgi:hypothetical protein
MVAQATSGGLIALLVSRSVGLLDVRRGPRRSATTASVAARAAARSRCAAPRTSRAHGDEWTVSSGAPS